MGQTLAFPSLSSRGATFLTFTRLDHLRARTKSAPKLRCGHGCDLAASRSFLRIWSGISRSVRQSNFAKTLKPMHPPARRVTKCRTVSGELRALDFASVAGHRSPPKWFRFANASCGARHGYPTSSRGSILRRESHQRSYSKPRTRQMSPVATLAAKPTK